MMFRRISRLLAHSDHNLLKSIVIPAAILMVTGFAHADPGECALDFLNIPVGAHGASIGQGGFARIEGPQAIFHNPAQIGKKAGGFASYQSLLLDTRSQAAAVGFPIGSEMSAGFGISVYDPGKIDGYTSDNVETGNVKSGDMLLRLGISRVGDLSYGISLSYYNQRLDDRTGTGFGFGLGISRDFLIGRLALTADNIGPDFKIGGASSPLPQRYSLSAWIPLENYYMNIIFDISYKRSLGIKASGGIECSPISGFFVRAGTSVNNPLSLGLGLTRRNIGFDYSYFPSGIFGDRHIFSFSILR
jgi:hypothetical protein